VKREKILRLILPDADRNARNVSIKISVQIEFMK